MSILKNHRQILEAFALNGVEWLKYLYFALTPLKANAVWSYHFCRQDNIVLVHRLG